jgi:cation-transporting ATPase E
LAKGDIAADGRLTETEPLAFVLLRDKIRKNAPTFCAISRSGSDLKNHFGDNPVTVSAIAQAAGGGRRERFLDARDASDEALSAAIGEYTVFGRVSPQQKRTLVRS